MARAGSQILDYRRGEHFTARGGGLNAGCEVYRHADDVVVGDLALARVQARADLDAESGQRIAQTYRTVERPGRRPETGDLEVRRVNLVSGHGTPKIGGAKEALARNVELARWRHPPRRRVALDIGSMYCRR